MPPIADTLEALRFAILPAFLAAAVVFYAVARLAPQRGVAVGGVLALLAGFLAGNHFRSEVVTFHLSELVPWLRGALLREPEAPRPPGTWFWLPWLSVSAMLVGLVTRPALVPRLLAPLVWLVVALLAARLLVREPLWVAAALVVTILVLWGVLDHVARQRPGGWLPLGLAGVHLAAGLVLVQAHTARLADVATIIAGCLLGLALVAWWCQCSIEGAIPAIAVALPCLLLVGYDPELAEVPWSAFVLLALAPITLGILLIPRLAQSRASWPLLVAFALLLVPPAIAVFQAMQVEKTDDW